MSLFVLSNLRGYLFFSFFIFSASKLMAAPVLRNNYQVYSPKITLHTVDTSYSHDATIVYFDNKWIAQWDDGTEKAGQRIRQSMSEDLKTWEAPVEVYSSGKTSKNPIEITDQESAWQPSLLVKDKELWSLFRAGSNVYFSKLSSSKDKWENRNLFGFKGADFRLPQVEGKYWGIFPGNAGIVALGGRVMVPVTLGLLDKQFSFYEQPKKDAVIYSDDNGKNWAISSSSSFGDGTQSWEATIWQPSVNRVNMISRNNRRGPFNVRENLKASHSSDNGLTWSEQRLIPAVDAAMSRTHVVRVGARNIMAQNDWYLLSENPVKARRNLSLYFSRGDRPDAFVAGLPITLGETSPDTIVDYPQIAIKQNGATSSAVVVYSSGSKTRITKAAEISPLPSDNLYYIFPRHGHSMLEVVKDGAKTLMMFKENYNSAGIDIDDNTQENMLNVAFQVRPESLGRQTIFDLSNGVTLIATNGRLWIKDSAQGSKEIDCGIMSVNMWSSIVFQSGKDRATGKFLSRARIGNGSFCTIARAPYPWQPYFGHNSFSDTYVKDAKQRFSIDLSSVMTRVD